MNYAEYTQFLIRSIDSEVARQSSRTIDPAAILALKTRVKRREDGEYCQDSVEREVATLAAVRQSRWRG